MNKTANIVGWDNGGGLSRDIDVLTAALQEIGWAVAVNGRRTRGADRTALIRAFGRIRRRTLSSAAARRMINPPFDLNLHLEDIGAEYLPLARRNVLIPNQEWTRELSIASLSAMDEIWVKTRLAERLFCDLGCRARLLGWMGSDRLIPDAASRRALVALHIAGSSLWKGTEAILDVWSENPGWPMLTVLRRSVGYDGQPLQWVDRAPVKNIRIVVDKLEEQELRRIQNESVLHICPSEAEGFGHIILEGMSVGAVVVTTDAPPMNEIIHRGNGLLVTAERSEPMGLGRRYFVNRRDLANNIDAALRMTDHERDSLGRASRLAFEANNDAFRGKLRDYLSRVAS